MNGGMIGASWPGFKGDERASVMQPVADVCSWKNLWK